MTNTTKTKYTSTSAQFFLGKMGSIGRNAEDYVSSTDYYKEQGRLEGYNEVMKWMNGFDVLENPEVHKVAKMMEMEFAVNRNRSLTPIADEIGVHVAAGEFGKERVE